ncbi:MAG: hypothetical protein K2X11_10645 [Acetobacteraceae bacterium]|nr:hypothetical protein [Acetobacteraceae bacterium]
MRAAAFVLLLALAGCAAPAPRDESRATPYATGVTIGGSMGTFWGATR